MTPEQALDAIAAAESQCDGSPWSVARLRYLVQVLLETPEQFWNEYLELAEPERLANGIRLMEELGKGSTHRDLQYAVHLEARRISALGTK